MNRYSVRAMVCLGIVVALVGAAQAQDAAPAYLSPIAVVANPAGSTLYIAAETGNAVLAFDTAAQSVARKFDVPGPPSGLALSADGARLYVTGSLPAGAIYVVNTGSGAIEATLPAGHSPCAPVLSPDGATLYVCNRFNNSVAVYDLAAGAEAARIDVLREPFAAAVTPDGATLVVANHLPAGASDGDYVAATVSLIDTAARSVTATVTLPNGSTGLRGLCLSPDGAFAYVTHILGRYQLPTTQLERGWMNTNAMSIIDIAGKSLLNTVLLDDVDLGAANPWGIACTADGAGVCVATAGTHEVAVIDRAAVHDRLARVAAGERVTEVSASPSDVPNDLSFLVGMKRRIRLEGNGPRGIAVVGTTVYAAEYFTDSLGVVDIDPETPARATSVALGPETEMSVTRRGQMFFNDAALCFQHWQSCASCHPDDRADGLNWDLLNDGIGNPKNTKSMLLAHQTPPAMSLGVRASAEVAVRAGIRFIQFAVRPEEDAVAIDEYLKSLEPTPSPYLVNGELSPAALRGREVFEKAQCGVCHPAPLYTDLNTHEVGTATPMDKDKDFDTPTLVEVWRTAPYLHDGRAATIEEVLKKYNEGDKHGVTSNLTEEELKDLAEFVLSL